MDSFFDVWESVCKLCSSKISTVAFDCWIKNLEPIRFNEATAELCAQSAYQKEIVDKYYIGFLKEAFEDVFGFPVEVAILLENSEKKRKVNLEAHPVTERYTFDTFVVGPSNRFAHAAALAVADKPGQSYNPLFLYGSSGLGKTHLLNAICNSIREDYPELKIIYKQGESFTNEIIDAIHGYKTAEFREKYRNTDVLVIDDIQFIVNKSAVQIEFFNTFNALFESSKQIIISSDRSPKELKDLDERMTSRFESGLLADIQTPDFETRLTIIKRKAENQGVELPEQTVQYIANEIKNNIRQLEGIVNKLVAHKNLSGEIPDLSRVASLISEVKKEDLPEPISLDKIISTVARYFNVTAQDICSKKQSNDASTARHYAIYVAREVTDLTLKTIGKYLGRDHSTASISFKKIESELKKNSNARELVNEMIKDITGEI